jgi:hypothetical protein
MRGFSVEQVELNAQQVEIRLIEHFAFIGAKSAQQFSAVYDEVTDSSADVHDHRHSLQLGDLEQ